MRLGFAVYDKLMPLKELKKSRYQRNKHTKEQIERLAKLMRENGVRHPIHISKLTGEVCFGHGRWEAAKFNKWKEYPVVYQDFKDETEEYACVQSDNAIALWAELDLAAINADLGDMGPDFDIDLLGIKDFVLEPAEKIAQCDEDEVPEPKESICKLGDIWKLGEHRLMCGDSTDIAAVERLMNGAKADMVFTDPPYRVSFKGQRFSSTTVDGKKVFGDFSANNKHDEIANDALDVESFKEFIRSVISNCFLSLKPSHAWYFCFAQSELHLLLNGIVEAGGRWKNIIIWMKNQANLSNMDYKSRYEPIVYFQSGGRFFGERYKTEDIWEFQRTLKNDLHPTMKPIPLIEYAISNSSEQKDSVLDLFGGSGSTLIACEKTNRKCFMMELDPHYCDVIIARWEKYTGNKAERIENG